MEANKAECSRGGTANKAMLQGRKKKKLKSETTRRHGTEWEALQSLLIVVCCQMRLTLSSVSSQAAMEQFSLQWQPGSFSFLLSFSLMQFQSSKQTRHVLSSGSSIPWKMTERGLHSSRSEHIQHRGSEPNTGPLSGVKTIYPSSCKTCCSEMVMFGGKHTAIM